MSVFNLYAIVYIQGGYMVLQELMPQIENLSREDKAEIFNYLLKDLGAESDYLMGCIHNPKVAGEAAHQLTELLKQGCITKELKAMEEAEAKYQKEVMALQEWKQV
jgi:hypothetical protein